PFLSSRRSPPPAISTLSLHDALPISHPAVDRAVDPMADDRAVGQPARRLERTLGGERGGVVHRGDEDLPPGIGSEEPPEERRHLDRKSTRLNSSHGSISYAVFCLKKK